MSPEKSFSILICTKIKRSSGLSGGCPKFQRYFPAIPFRSFMALISLPMFSLLSFNVYPSTMPWHSPSVDLSVNLYYLYALLGVLGMLHNKFSKSRKALLRNKELFLKYNRYRLKKAFEIMPKKTTFVFRAIPFLIHVNHESFPGYVDGPETPGGIQKFKMFSKTRNALNILFPKAQLELDHFRSFVPEFRPVLSLLLMGSIGTIAQAEESDYDFWVCMEAEHLESNRMVLFLRKLKLIEDWAGKKYGVEIHFFPMDIKKVQKNQFGKTDKESSGSSQANLLKEEFYRTMILLVGKIPIWWIMPPGIKDDEYAKLKKKIFKYKYFGEANFIDLGNLYRIPLKEFIGAALWQMNKAMDSPLKSALKMGMLEGYIGSKGKKGLLCTELKKKVLYAEKDTHLYDPYMVMFRHTLNYYKKNRNEEIQDLLCKCFYIKSGVKVNFITMAKENTNFKEKSVLKLVKNWGWDQNKLDDLNHYRDWSFDRVLDLGCQVHDYMRKTYGKLTERLPNKSSRKKIITDNDRTVLGRKLFTFYSQKPNKIEHLRRAFDDGFLQDNLTFHSFRDRKRRAFWGLYRGRLTMGELEETHRKEKLAKKDSNLLYIIFWMVYNRICDLETTLYLTPHPMKMSLADIQRLVKAIVAFFPDFKISTLRNEDLLTDARKEKVFIVLNFASDRGEKNVESLTIVYLTSWGELFFENYANPKKGIAKTCEYIMAQFEKDLSGLPRHFQIFVPKGRQSETITKNFHASISKKVGPIPRIDK